MEVSNRTLAVFLLAAIVVSLAGTIVSLNRLNTVTGMAGSAFGNVSLVVGTTLSITTQDSNLLNFGACSPCSGVECVINSEAGFNTSAVCPAYTGGSITNITCRNDGNVPANVSIRANGTGAAQGGTFMTSVSAKSAIAYRSEKQGRGAYTNGCAAGNVQVAYINFSSTTTNYTGCSNLSAGATANTFITQFQLIVPFDVAVGGYSDMITYQATNG